MIRPGSHYVFSLQFEDLLKKQWYSDSVEPSLRMMIITAGMLYHEQGCSRVRILKLLGNDAKQLENRETAHYYGCAADISVRELIDPRVNSVDLMMQKRFPKAVFITQRLNDLFPLAQGDKESAIYNMTHIHLECPIGGFKRETQALATWNESGSIGIPKVYRKTVERQKGVW